MMKKTTKTNSAHIYLPLLRRKIRLHNIIDTMRLHDTNIILYGIMPLIDSLHYSTIPKVITKYDNDTIPIIVISKLRHFNMNWTATQCCEYSEENILQVK